MQGLLLLSNFRYRNVLSTRQFKLIQEEGGGGGGGGKEPKPPTPFPPNSFSPVTSTNVGISPQSFLTFSFNFFATLVWNSKTILNASPKLLNLNQDHSSKKVVFLVKPL